MVTPAPGPSIQRTRVAGLGPHELDEHYANRIMLETLALSMTMSAFGTKTPRKATRLLAAMRRAATSGDFTACYSPQRFSVPADSRHGSDVAAAARDPPDRTARNVRIYQLSEPSCWQAPGDVEHAGF
jgi:hypothetical protein